MAVGAALAILPVLRSWQLTEDGDTAATTLAVFAGAAWQIGAMLPRIQARPRPLTRWLALAALGLGMWQLAWIGTDDFWFLKIALVIWAAAWLALAWGVAGWIWGWRILAAFALWAWLCDAPWQWSRDAYQTGDAIGPALAIITTKVAGTLLTLGGAPVHVSQQFLQWGANTVSVGVPCTGLPLVKLLWLLLVLATLLLRLRPLRAGWLAIMAAAIAFVTSVIRVMVLAAVVGNSERFHYWHDPDRGGVGWFTAAGMLILAFLFARQFFGQQAMEAHPPSPSPMPPRPPDPRWLVAATALALLIAQIPFDRPSPAARSAPAETNFILNGDAKTPLPASPSLSPDQPAWIRRLTYRESPGGGLWTVAIADRPHSLEPDPRDQPGLEDAIPPTGPWRPLPGGGFTASARSGEGSAWLAMVAPGLGALRSDNLAWRDRQRIFRAGPGRWSSWLLHRSRLRDKQCYWLAVWGQPTTDGSPPKLFSDWIALLRQAD